MMKNIICLLLLSITVLSCNKTVKKTDGYIINGTATGVYNGIRVYLKTVDERNRETYQDTAIVVDGKFVFEGKLDYPELWYLSVNSVEGTIPVMVENGNIDIVIDKNNISASKVSGTPSNDALIVYNEGFNALMEKRQNLGAQNRSILTSNDSVAKAKFTADMEKMNEEMQNYPFQFLASNKDNYFSLKLIESLLTSDTNDLNKIENSLNNLEDSIKNSAFGQMVAGKLSVKKMEMERLTALNIGGVAPDFTAPNPDGKMVSLNDIKGKVTIIDFWASWCGPCRRENPNVVKVYNKFHSKGLEIISVSLDRAGQKDKWLKAIEDDKLTWHHVSNLNYFNDPVARLYDIQSIPSTFILDSEGKIVAKKLRGQELEDKIAEMLN